MGGGCGAETWLVSIRCVSSDPGDGGGAGGPLGGDGGGPVGGWGGGGCDPLGFSAAVLGSSGGPLTCPG